MANKDKVINLRINSEAYEKLKEYCKEDMGVSQFVTELVKKELVKQDIMDIADIVTGKQIGRAHV